MVPLRANLFGGLTITYPVPISPHPICCVVMAEGIGSFSSPINACTAGASVRSAHTYIVCNVLCPAQKWQWTRLPCKSGDGQAVRSTPTDTAGCSAIITCHTSASDMTCCRATQPTPQSRVEGLGLRPV
jgi:hypothetical protein